jgi:membrane peptidoglycan carboxypeptidase
MYIPGVDSAAKTGTSNASNAAGSPKDIWMVNYSQTLTMAVWLGNPDTTPLKNNATSIVPGQILDSVLQYAYKTDYQNAGKWKPGDWIQQPSGIQRLGCSSKTLVTGNGKFDQACGEVYPSYWSANQGLTDVDFDSVTKKLATDCTPSGAKVTVKVIKIPLASSFTPNQALYVDPNGIYTLAGSQSDGAGDCSHASSTNLGPVFTVPPAYSGSATNYTVSTTVTANGSNTIQSVSFTVAGHTYTGVSQGNGVYSATLPTTVVLAPNTSDFATAVDSVGQQNQANFTN